MIVFLLAGFLAGGQGTSSCLAEPIPKPGQAITASYNGCIQRELAAEKIRMSEMAAVMESAAPDLRVAYNALTIAFGNFRDAHVAHEVCLPGARCREIEDAARARLTMEMLTVAQRLGKPESFTSADLEQADAAMNKMYEGVMAGFPMECPTSAACQSQTTLRDTQRDWIRYRDALSTFATLRWKADSATWLTLLTRERTAELDAIPRRLSTEP